MAMSCVRIAIIPKRASVTGVKTEFGQKIVVVTRTILFAIIVRTTIIGGVRTVDNWSVWMICTSCLGTPQEYTVANAISIACTKAASEITANLILMEE